MKRIIPPIFFLTLIIFLPLSCAIIAFSTKPPASINPINAVFFVQTTPSPPIEENGSEVGSTDEIVVMGGVIVAIILVPILLQRKAWVQKDQT